MNIDFFALAAGIVHFAKDNAVDDSHQVGNQLQHDNPKEYVSSFLAVEQNVRDKQRVDDYKATAAATLTCRSHVVVPCNVLIQLAN